MMEIIQNPFCFINLLTGLIFIITTMIISKYPPKGINPIYGYRTKSSMKSIDRWNFAQSYSTELLHKIGILMLILGVLGYFITLPKVASVILSLIILTALLIYLVVKTENAIKEKFGE